MSKLILFLVISLGYIAVANNIQDIKVTDSITFQDIENLVDVQGVSVGNTHETFYRTSLGSKARLSSKYAEIDYDIEGYTFSKNPDKIENISLPFKYKSGIQINSLYTKLHAPVYEDNELSLYYGAIPFRGGRFSEIKTPNISGGNGLAIINNQVYDSLFLSYTTDSTTCILGRSEFKTREQYNGLLDKNDKSSGIYAIITHEEGKHFFEADYYDMKVKYYNLNYAKLKVGGVGYIYDDSLSSGFTFYTNLGMSSISENVTGLTTLYNIPQTYLPYLANKGAIIKNTSEVKGYAGLVGLDYEFDTSNHTWDVGVEVFMTKDGWVSANHGVLFQSDHSYWTVRNGVETIIYGGVDITKNLRFQVKASNIDSRDVPANFTISGNKSEDTAYNGHLFFRHVQTVTADLSYKF